MTTMLETRAFVSYERGFDAVVGDDPRLVKVADIDAHEGPVYVRRGAVLHDAARSAASLARSAASSSTASRRSASRPCASTRTARTG